MKRARVYANAGSIKKKVLAQLHSLTKHTIRRRAAGIFRTSLVEVLQDDKRTRRFAHRISELRVETRGVWNVHVGSGMRLKIAASGRIQSGVDITERFVGDKGGYWTLMTAQHGRKALPARSSKHPYVLAILPSKVRGAQRKTPRPYYGSNTRYADGSYAAVFTTGPIKAVAPWYQWMDKAHTLMIGKFDKMLREI